MERKSQYHYLSKNEKNSVDCIDTEQMLRLLEHGEYALFARVLGVLGSMCQHNEHLNDDQKRCLMLPHGLLEASNKLLKVIEKIAA
jgi:hypothetical protein